METIDYQENNGIAKVVFNRPKKGNTINALMAKELCLVLDTYLIDNSSLRVVVLEGQGANFMCGADVTEFVKGEESIMAFTNNARRFMRKLATLPMFTVATVYGNALGGGLEMALASDYIIASDDARFGFPEIRFNLIPGAGGTQLLPKKIGYGKAKRMILSGETIDAQMALQYGLIDELLPQSGFGNRIQELYSQLVNATPEVMKYAKQSINNSTNMPDYTIEARNFKKCIGLPETQERIASFLEKSYHGK